MSEVCDVGAGRLASFEFGHSATFGKNAARTLVRLLLRSNLTLHDRSLATPGSKFGGSVLSTLNGRRIFRTERRVMVGLRPLASRHLFEHVHVGMLPP